MGRYVLLDEIGHGGMGSVYSAYDPELARRVAVKIVRLPAGRDQAARERWNARLVAEAQALAQLSHPNICAIFDVGTTDAGVYMAMELVEGQTLRALLDAEQGGGINPSVAIPIMLQAGRGLAAAHAAGLLHSDIKPSNIMVEPSGRVCMLDFGLASQGGLRQPSSTTASTISRAGSKSQSSRHTATTGTQLGGVAGSLGHMSPEQMQGAQLDERSDIFAFCVCFYEACVGHLPFVGKTTAELDGAMKAGVARRRPREIPRNLWPLIRSGLAHDYDLRPAEIERLLHVLALHYEGGGRRGPLLVASVALAMMTTGAMAYAHADHRKPCPLRAEPAEQLWSARAKDQVRAAFAAHRTPGTADMFHRLDTHMRSQVVAWGDARDQLCRERSELPGLQFDASVGCLRQLQTRAQSLARILASSDDRGQQNALVAARELSAPSSCLELGTHATAPQKATDLSVIRGVARVRARIPELAVFTRLVRLEQARELADELLLRAEKLGHLPLRAEVEYHAALSAYESSDHARAATLARRAFATATASAHDEVASLASSLYVFLGGYRMAAPPAEQAVLAALARASMLRTHARPDLLAEYRMRAGFSVIIAGDAAEGESMMADAAQYYTDIAPEPSLKTLTALHDLGIIQLGRGEMRSALRHLQKAHQLGEQMLGPEHEFLYYCRASMGLVHRLLGQPREALRWGAAAYAMLQRSNFESGRFLTNYYLNALADVQNCSKLEAVLLERHGSRSRDPNGCRLPYPCANSARCDLLQGRRSSAKTRLDWIRHNIFADPAGLDALDAPTWWIIAEMELELGREAFAEGARSRARDTPSSTGGGAELMALREAMFEGRAHEIHGELESARAAFRRAEAAQGTGLDANHVELGRAALAVARSSTALGDFEAARAALARAERIYRVAEGETSNGLRRVEAVRKQLDKLRAAIFIGPV